MFKKTRKLVNNRKGFTLVELIVVIAIIGIIAFIAIPRFGLVQSRSQWDADAATLRNIAKAAEVYVVQQNNFADVTTATLQQANLIDDPITLKFPASDIVYTSTGTSLTIDIDPNTGKATMDDATIQGIIGARP